MNELILKAKAVVASCKTHEQLAVAERYVKLVHRKFGRMYFGYTGPLVVMAYLELSSIWEDIIRRRWQ
jgi:glycerol-3-phosphate O-acyltransferase